MLVTSSPMGKRDVASFAVIVLFGASLAATSKPKGDRDEEEDGAVRERRVVQAADGGGAEDSGKTTALAVDAALPTAEVAAPDKNAELPDTTAWKPFVHTASKLAAKTPPNAEVTCTKTGELTSCSVVRHGKTLAHFVSLKIETEGMIYMMKRDTALPSIAVFEDASSFAVMRNDPKQGSWCEFVAGSPSGLKAVESAQQTDAGVHAVTLNRTECLEMIAFGRTLVRTP